MSNHKSRVMISVDLSHSRAHLFSVNISIEGAKTRQKLSLPVWTPGSYMIREFAQHIVSVTASENGQKILVTKENKNTFVLANTSSLVMLSYQVYGFDSSIRAAFIDDSQAFFNGTALFLRPHELEQSYFSVKIIRPTEDHFSNWQVATNLTACDIDDDGFGTYEAHSYDELVDHPFQISPMKRLSFNVGSIPHELVLVGDVRDFDEERLVTDLTKLCEQEIKLFALEIPFSSYLFIARFEEGNYGGLEHRNSSMLVSSPYGLLQKNKEPDNNYRNFLSLCAHEYFHAWVIKSLKPENFLTYDFDHECYTSMLWIFEGITSYYDDLLVHRAGLMSVQHYLETMSKNYTRLLRNRGRRIQSVAEASFDAWIKFYRPNENSLNVSTSYYLKGSFIALYLDLLIRTESQGLTSLDDVMRVAHERCGRGKGITEEKFFALLQEIGGIPALEIKQKYIYGVDELPLKDALLPFGIELLLVSDDTSVDEKIKMTAFLGMKIRFDDNGRAVISAVEQDGPAMHAGLSPFDEIIAINNIRLDPQNSADLFARLCENEWVSMLCARKKTIKNYRIQASSLPKTISKWQINPQISPVERNRLNNWLGLDRTESDAHLISIPVEVTC